MYSLRSCDGFVLQREAREHFGCPTLNGVELENQGGVGTALQHWEKRVLGVSNHKRLRIGEVSYGDQAKNMTSSLMILYSLAGEGQKLTKPS